MACHADSPETKPALWSAYVHGSRLTRIGRRALLLGINGGLGHHRYPGIGSGDVYAAWQTLYFEIYLSFTAANTVTEWNHDLGECAPSNLNQNNARPDQHQGNEPNITPDDFLHEGLATEVTANIQLLSRWLVQVGS